MIYYNKFSGYDLSEFKPLFCQSQQIGFVAAKVEEELLDFQDTFAISPKKIDICPRLKSYSEITEKIEIVMKNFRKNDVFIQFREWNDEKFDVRQSMGKAPLFAIERAAVPLFGLLSYYINITAYVLNDDGSTSVWLQRRSLTARRFPGKLDRFVSVTHIGRWYIFPFGDNVNF